MFSVGDHGVRLCEGMTRRRWLRVGGLGAAGLLLPDLLRGRETARNAGRSQGDRTFGRARACILCFLFGAPAHQDVWDLKPEAPAEFRGEFRPIATNVPGIRLGEHVPLTAGTAHRLAVVRSVGHPDNTHTVAMHYMLTGHRHAQPETNPRNQPTDFPTFGAVAQYLGRGRAGLPAGVSLNAPANQVSANNHIFPGFFAGLLGSAHDPVFIAQDPSLPDFRPLPTADGALADRFRRRRGLLAEVDRQRRDLEASAGQFDEYHDRAFRLVTSPAARQAFDMGQEPDRVRARYGWSAFGQGLLLARRLVEAGVTLVTVNWARDDAFWDTHKDNFKDLKEKLLPPFDLGFSALLEDLDQRGLLEETLVLCLGEFGRTPRINPQAGRDHWAACNSVVLAGGGVRGGQVYGASDRLAAYPATSPVSPGDLATTIYHALGIDPRLQIHDRLGRPLPLAEGKLLGELFS
jgi:hypothetical protein